MSFPARTGLIALAAAAALAVSGCGETVIDDVKAEGAVQDSLEKSLDAKVTSVECPSDQEVEAGKRFDCTADVDGEPATVTLKILNDDADVKIVGLKPGSGQ